MDKIAILGFGREGKSLLKFLKETPKYRDAEIEILDQKQGKDYLKNLSDFDLVFRSPGVPYNLSEIQRAIKNGVKFSSATKLFFDLCTAKIIGITGTKGKGTTSTILYQILKKCGRDVYLAGNIGKPATDILPKLRKNSLVILELSSFQLQDLQKSPPIAVVVDTFPDHLDAHKNMNEYVNAKSNIARYQKRTGVIFYFKDNLLSRGIAQKSLGAKIGIAGNPFGLRKNKTMAAAVASYLGCPPEKIASVIKNFKGMPHRMQLIRTIKPKIYSSVLKNTRIDFYDDSASTNPQTAAAAIHSLSNVKCKMRHEQSKNKISLSLACPAMAAVACPMSLILIAGGKDKNLDYAPLADAIRESNQVKAVILFGENKNKIAKTISSGTMKLKIGIRKTKDLKSAVELAYKSARSMIQDSIPIGRQARFMIHVLFSPASASFDMFKDYADRGEQFKKIVKSLKIR